jgi:hypothetical protein
MSLHVCVCAVAGQFTVTVIANNSYLGAELVCTITVTDVAEPPFFVTTAFEVNQDDAFPGTSVGFVVANDQDADDYAVYEKVPPDTTSAWFVLNSGSGEITIAMPPGGDVHCLFSV